MAIQLFVPTYDVEACLNEIRECLQIGWTGLGYKTVQFEEEWKKYTGHPHAHFLNSATSALHLAVNILKETSGWSDDDEVITTPITFVSTNHAILYERMKPVFADVDESLCLDPASIESRLTPRTRAVMFVGMGGNVGQLDKVQSLCKDRGLKLILDAAHMSGTRFRGKVPSADVVCYSFQAVKPLPTGDSGMICFASADLDALSRRKSWMGINKDTFARTNDKGAYKWEYDVESVGWKYNGNSIMAAIAIAQLRNLDRDSAYRRQIADWYTEGLSSLKAVAIVPVSAGCVSSRHLFQIRVQQRDELMLALNRDEIYPGVHYADNRKYRMFKVEKDDCPSATRASAEVVSLPIHMRMTKSDVDAVVDAIRLYAH